MTRAPIRVALVDDHPIVRAGLKALLERESDMVVVGEGVDGHEAVQLAEALRPDVLVMDITMAGGGGAEATTQVRRAHPEVRVLALTAHEDTAYARWLLKCGAVGYVLKRAAAEDLVLAIRAVAAGGIYLDPAVAAHVLPADTRTVGRGAVTELSEREAEVVKLIAQGHAMKEIASRLGLAPRTLETYKARAMEKLKLTTRADIVRYAITRGWLGDPSG